MFAKFHKKLIMGEEAVVFLEERRRGK